MFSSLARVAVARKVKVKGQAIKWLVRVLTSSAAAFAFAIIVSLFVLWQ
jgi:hypothetical protein